MKPSEPMKLLLNVVAALGFGVSLAVFATTVLGGIDSNAEAAIFGLSVPGVTGTGLYLVRALVSAFAGEVGRPISTLEEALKNLARGLKEIAEEISLLSTAPPSTPAARAPGIDPQMACRVLGLNPDRDVVFVYPPRQEEPGSILPRVAGEDFMAITEMLDLVGAAGFDRRRIRMTPVDRETASIQENERDNLVLICASRSNPMTGKVLGLLRQRCGLMADFRLEECVGRTLEGVGVSDVSSDPGGVEPKPPQFIAFYGRDFHSPTYETDRKLKSTGLQPWRGEMTDYGLIVRARNPLNPDNNTVTLVIAGIRGIGTWGAARHLWSRLAALNDQYEGKDFAAVIGVHYNNFRIGWTVHETGQPLACP